MEVLDVEPLMPSGRLAIAAWNMLHNGHGAIDWSGIGLVCALLGVNDIERLLLDLQTIKSFDPPDAAGESSSKG